MQTLTPALYLTACKMQFLNSKSFANNHTKPLKYTFRYISIFCGTFKQILPHNIPEENNLKLWKVKAVPITATW